MSAENIHKYANEAWPYRFTVGLHVPEIHGGVPRNPDVVRAWLRAKAGWTDEMEIEAEVQRIFYVNPELSDKEVAEGATEELASKHVNGFVRDHHGLYIRGGQLKAAIKESASVARNANRLPERWGTTKKSAGKWVPEHIMVVEDRLYLGKSEHDDLHTRFVRTFRGSGITVEEVCYDVDIEATIIADWNIPEREWAMIWLTLEQEGIGASRSQGFGRCEVTKWEPTA